MRRESRPAGPSSFERLRTYLENRAAYTSDEIDFLRSLFVPRSLRKSEFLQRAGERARYKNDRGEERRERFPRCWVRVADHGCGERPDVRWLTGGAGLS